MGPELIFALASHLGFCTVRFSSSTQFSFYVTGVTAFARLPSSWGHEVLTALVNSVGAAVSAVQQPRLAQVLEEACAVLVQSLALDSLSCYPVFRTPFPLHLMVAGEPCSPFFLGVYPFAVIVEFTFYA